MGRRRFDLTYAEEKGICDAYVAGTPIAEIKRAFNLGSGASIYKLLQRRGIAERRIAPMKAVRRKYRRPCYAR